MIRARKAHCKNFLLSTKMPFISNFQSQNSTNKNECYRARSTILFILERDPVNPSSPSPLLHLHEESDFDRNLELPLFIVRTQLDKRRPILFIFSPMSYPKASELSRIYVYIRASSGGGEEEGEREGTTYFTKTNNDLTDLTDSTPANFAAGPLNVPQSINQPTHQPMIDQ